jgi:hypothetical protein
MLAEIGSTQKLGFIVSKRKLNEKESYFGLPLYSIDEFSCLEKGKYMVIIPPSEFKDELIANCQKYNFNFAVVGVNSENKENSLNGVETERRSYKGLKLLKLGAMPCKLKLYQNLYLL